MNNIQSAALNFKKIESNVNGMKRFFHLAALLVLVLLLISIPLYLTPPQPKTSETPLGEFSSERALEDLKIISEFPHATGTAENILVRQYIVKKLRNYGLSPIVEKKFAISTKYRTAGLVSNIIVRVPGKKNSKALMLTAHFDSVPTGNGAADNGASVAAMLETIRAIQDGERLDNDLLFVFTDGEEAGLLGAEAFLADKFLVNEIGLVLNFDYRGNTGPILMFETSKNNSAIISELSKTSEKIIANSAMSLIYKYLPNSTDLEVLKKIGAPAMNFAAIGNFMSYHTQGDTVALINHSTLQHEGNIMLSLIKNFGNNSLNAPEFGQRVYFDIPWIGLVSYTLGLAPFFSGIVFLALVGSLLREAKAHTVSINKILIAGLLFPLSCAIISIGSQLVWYFILLIKPDLKLILHGDVHNRNTYFLAYSFFTLSGIAVYQSILARWCKNSEIVYGAMICWGVLLIVVTLVAPEASYILTWPLLLSVLARYLWSNTRLSENIKVVLPVLINFPGLFMLGSFGLLLFTAVTLSQIYLIALFFGLVCGLLLPNFSWIRSSALAKFSAVAFSVTLGFALSAPSFGRENPRPSDLFYAVDGLQNKAYWLSGDEKLDIWTRRFFGHSPVRQPMPALYGPWPAALWSIPAPVVIKAPTISILKDVTEEYRTVVFSVKTNRNAPRFTILCEGVPVMQSAISNHMFTDKPEDHWKLVAHGFTDDQLLISVVVPKHKRFDIRVIESSYRLPLSSSDRWPAGMMPQPFYYSNMSQVISLVHFS